MKEREIGSKFDFRVSNHDEFALRIAGKIARRDFHQVGVGTALRFLETRRPRYGELINPWSIAGGTDWALTVIARNVDKELQDKNYLEVLMTANTLHPYAEIQHQDGLSGNALAISLDVHRNFSDHLREDFGKRALFLISRGEQVQDTIDFAQGIGDTWKEYETHRAVIHLLALQGYLGSEALEHVDPFALISVR